MLILTFMIVIFGGCSLRAGQAGGAAQGRRPLGSVFIIPSFPIIFKYFVRHKNRG